MIGCKKRVVYTGIKGGKYYIKGGNKNYISKMKGGIDDLIQQTETVLKIAELPTDIKQVNCKHNDNPGCIQCVVCGSTSGTTLIIPHYYTCKYKVKETIGPFTEGIRDVTTTRIDPSKSVAILQREYGIISSETEKTIIGTYGAATCIILCMRNRDNGKTILAHIDSLSIDPLNVFFEFPADKCDVYIIGGDDSTKPEVNNILKELKSRNYEIKFAHIIDGGSNSFAINCITGDTYVNDDINPITDLPPVYDVKIRELRMMQLPYNKTSLNLVKIM